MGSTLTCLRALRARSLVALLAVILPRAFAQGVEVTAGASSLTGVNGVTATHYLGDHVSLLSLGVAREGLVFGGATEVQRTNGVTRYGDTALGFSLPTDVSPAGRSVAARGLDWSWAGAGSSLQFFAGKTGDPIGVGYIKAVDPERWGASMVLQKALLPKWKLTAIGAAGAAHTALASVDYVHGPRLEFAATTGWNAGHAIFAITSRLRGDSWNLQINETAGHLELRPETSAPHSLDEQHVPEREGFNIGAEKRFTRWLQGDAERISYGADAAGGLPQGARLFETGLTAHNGDWTSGVRILQSSDGSNPARGIATLTSWASGPWKLEGSLLEGWSTANGHTTSFIADMTRDFNARVSVTGGVNLGNSSPNLVGGVELHGRWGSIGMSERVVYVPFGGSAGFERVTALSLELHPHGVETHLYTLIGGGTPWTYTAVSNGFVELQNENGGGSSSNSHTRSFDLAKFVVRGKVLDEQDQPVPLAAVRVNGATVWTNEAGVWESRQHHAGKVHLLLDPKEFMTAMRYEAETDAMEASAQPEGEAKLIVLRVRRSPGDPRRHIGPNDTQSEQANTDAQEAGDSGQTPSVGWLHRLKQILWMGDPR